MTQGYGHGPEPDDDRVVHPWDLSGDRQDPPEGHAGSALLALFGLLLLFWLLVAHFIGGTS